METAEVARRAHTENFPIASLLFPRPLRPHLRAIYGFCRFAGDRLDEPSPELRACLEFEGERARRLLESGRLFRERVPGRTGRAVRLFARGGLAALAALERSGWDVYGGRPRPSRARLA